MNTVTFHNKTYQIDGKGFLLDSSTWDEDFAVGMAAKAKIRGGLTPEHWQIIRFVRGEFQHMNTCPLVYVACRKNHLDLGRLERLFPTGYLRGVCRLAGISYRDGMFQHYWLEENYKHHEYTFQSRTYEVDEVGFLVHFDGWDEGYALFRAFEAKMPGYLTPSHWEVLKAARSLYRDSGQTPDPESLAEHVSFDVEELDLLFIDGWQRGVLRLAGIPQEQPLRRYVTDVMGFLVDWSTWTEGFAVMKARDLKMELPLGQRHWDIISYLQRKFRRGKVIPNIYTVCKRCHTDLGELERLFPDGYHRGAVKLAGLRAL